jgi:hypothetical protein
LGQVVHDRPVAGLQLYDDAPDAVSTVVLPAHTDVLPDIVTVGNWLTATVTVEELLQPLPEVPTTVYVVVVDGVATGDAHAAQESVAAGVHT